MNQKFIDTIIPDLDAYTLPQAKAVNMAYELEAEDGIPLYEALEIACREHTANYQKTLKKLKNFNKQLAALENKFEV